MRGFLLKLNRSARLPGSRESPRARPATIDSMKYLLALLCLVLPIAACAAADSAADPIVEGRDYYVVEGGQPYRPLDGRIEVAEVFAYTCPHCASFQPVLSAWARKLPADVRFTYVPAAFGPGETWARAFFVAERAGAVQRTHEALYRAVHQDHLLAHNATAGELAWFYGQHGLGQAAMKVAMLSPEIEALVRHAREFALAIRLPGTPTLVVNGKYVVTPANHAEALRITDALVARLRDAPH